MLCQSCKENPATVHVTEIVHPSSPPPSTSSDASHSPLGGDALAAGASSPSAEADGVAASGADASGADAGGAGGIVQEQHLCEACAEAANLPHMPVVKKSVAEIWKLLQGAAQRGRREASVACPDCGMTLIEFRQRGRFGCPKDYEVFTPHLRDLLERIHGATKHVGRVPGLDPSALERLQRVNELQKELEAAIREEAYEQAARLRDELKSLQAP